MEKQASGNRLGKRNKDLLILIDNTENWEQYVNEKTATIVKSLKKTKSMLETSNLLDMKYITVRDYLLRAAKQIGDKKLDPSRIEKSQLANELFDLMNLPTWKVGLTDKEIVLAEKFKELKNFYLVKEEL